MIWGVLAVIVILVAAGSAVLEAYLDFKQISKAPKEEMFWCHKHGAFPKKYTLPLFPELGGRPLNSNVCPTCYKQAVFDEPNKKLG